MPFSGVLSEIRDGWWLFVMMHLEIPLARIQRAMIA